jgi:hypothetical protein
VGPILGAGGGFCPDGGSPKCVQCWNDVCNWACAKGYYCYDPAGPKACAEAGVSCGGKGGKKGGLF